MLSYQILRSARNDRKSKAQNDSGQGLSRTESLAKPA
jgi:hypothetical protein